MPPTPRPIPRHIAEPPLESEPYGRWAERLAGQFLEACAAAGVEEADAASIAWYPQRAWNGRSYVPATAALPAGAGELFGFVSYVPGDLGGEPDDFAARAEVTEETAAANPDWLIDISDEAIGAWRGPAGAKADVTLAWGVPLRPGAAIATAELSGETVDQCEISKGGGFTLIALDAVEGFGDTLYLEVALWDRRSNLLATESLYEEDDAG